MGPCAGGAVYSPAITDFVFMVEGIYILLWTKVIDILCKRGLSNVAWFLVLFPYILMFLLIGLFMLNLGVEKKEVHIVHTSEPPIGASFI
mgnify:CR=1 FL=1